MTFCILDTDCAVYDRHSKLSGITRRAIICEGCFNRGRSDLNLLRYDFVDLSQRLPPADSRSDAHIFRPKPESSPPLDMSVLALRDDLVELLTDAEDALRAWVGDRPRLPWGRVRDGFAVDQAVRYLSERVDDLADVPVVCYPDPPGRRMSGAQALVEFGAMHRRARRCVGLLEPVVALPGPCPRCGVVALRRRDGDDARVWCQQCRAAMTKDDYYRACRMQFAPVTPEQPGRFT